MRPRGLLCLDFDGTLVDGLQPEMPFVWPLLHAHFGTPPGQVEAMRIAFFSGQCTYEEWFNHDLRLLMAAGADRAGVKAALAPLWPMSGVRETVIRIKAEGFVVAVLSGSVDTALDHFFPDVPFDEVLINRLIFDQEGRLVGGIPTRFDVGAKADGLKYLKSRHGADWTVYVGDSFNDIAAARTADISIAFNCHDQELASIATHVVPSPARDLRAIIPLILASVRGKWC